MSTQPFSPSEIPLEAYITIRDVADALKVHPRTVTRLAARGLLPQGVKIGGVRRWRQRDVVEHLKKLAKVPDA